MAASLKNIGEKTVGLFDRKKKEVEQLTAEKVAEAEQYAGEQAKKAGEAVEQTKKEVGGIISSTGLSTPYVLFFLLFDQVLLAKKTDFKFKKFSQKIAGDEASASANNAADSIENAKKNLGQLADDASSTAAQAKSTAGNLFDHAKGAANEALAAGTKAAENIVDQKLKEAETVSSIV